MAQQQETPIYWDQHASRWNLTLIFSLVVAVLGFMTGLLLTALGLAMAAFSWLTTPRQFLLYRDRMTIVYGMPRTKVISFAEISHAEILALPIGARLRLRMIAGNRMMLSMRDPATFLNHLEDAIALYHGEQTGDYYGEQTGEFYVEGGGTVLTAPGEAGREMEGDFGTGVEVSEEEARAAFYGDSPAESESYTGRVEEAASTSGSYVEEAASTSGSYVEVEEPLTEVPETAPDEQASGVAGSYTETAEPDFSGEGSPAYGAEIELETNVSDKSDEERPPSPY